MSKQTTVLITGASSGIGKSCAEHLTQKGYRVYGTSRSPKQVESGIHFIQMDVTDDQSVQQGIQSIMAKENRLDVVVNCAGFGLAGAVEDTTIEEAKAQLETNFFGVHRVCRSVLPLMRRQEAGCIVNISSIGGVIGIPFQGMYSASKFAVEGLTEALRMEVSGYGIRVVMIEPGDFCTNLTANRVKAQKATEDSVYHKDLTLALGVMERDEMHGPHPRKVAYLLERIINNPNPRLRYAIGPISEQAAIVLKNCLPQKLFQWLMMKYYRL